MKPSEVPLQSLPIVPVWTLPPMAFGVVHFNGLTLMFKYSTLMLPPTANKASPPCIRITSASRSGPMNKEYARWNTVPLHLIISATGGCGKAANVCYKRLVSLLALKWDQPYSLTLAWMRCKLSFALLRSTVQCFCGAHSGGGRAFKQVAFPADLAMTETNTYY